MKVRIVPDLGGASIVLLGSFNPKIFQPFWMAKQGLISDSEAEAADISVIHPEITAFMIEDLFTIQVNPTSFSIERNVDPLIYICDMVNRLFSEQLPHVPMHQMGINRSVHFEVGHEERERIGLMLAPREPWGEWGREVSSGEGQKHGGLQSLTLVQRNLADRAFGWIQAKIEPSVRIGRGQTGIYMEVNDHYQLTETSETSNPEAMMELLTTVFDNSIRRSEGIIDQIMGLRQ